MASALSKALSQMPNQSSADLEEYRKAQAALTNWFPAADLQTGLSSPRKGAENPSSTETPTNES